MPAGVAANVGALLGAGEAQQHSCWHIALASDRLSGTAAHSVGPLSC